ncbi:MAG: 2-keto-4-pentenoate hydratase, partial [Hyphomicrobiaceae bacterium]
FGVGEPFFGPFFPATIHRSPAVASAAAYDRRIPEVGQTHRSVCLESEFAFRLGKTLPVRALSYSRDEILDAIDALLPAFEIVAPRYHRLPFDSVGETIADCGLNGGMVLGPPTADWHKYDLPSHRVRLMFDGEPVAEGTGANVLESPFNVLDWLVNALCRRSIGLEAGQILSTGTTTGIHYVKQGVHAVADFGPLGRVEARFE